MPVTLNTARNRRKARRVINIHQNKFTRGYVSTIDNSRRPQDSLSDMTNMEVVQDNVVRPRPPLTRYGVQPTLPVIGRGHIRQDGQRLLLWMLNDGGTGKLYKQADGEAFEIIDDGGSYDDGAWASNVQSKGKAYVFNGVDNLSYVDLSDDTIHTYTALTTPTISSVVAGGMSGTTYEHFYRVTANNDVGESIASVVGSVATGKIRDAWILNTDYIDITWAAVTGASSYTVYYGTSADTTNELYTVADALTFRDDGSLKTNPFKLAPEGNSTEGAVFTWMYVDTKNSQIFGITADNKLYYSAAGTGDFSPYNGGGFVTIDEDGDTKLNYVDGFRNGKGDPVITVSARGAAGKGKLYHVSFDSLTVGDQVIIYPNVYEANGQAGTYAPRATVKTRDSLWYPTGLDFKTTGTSQNVVNILTTNSISQAIQPDVDRLSLQNLDKAVAVENKEAIYFALPVGSTENNEIWYIDLARKNLWVLRWTVAARDLWMYESSDGATHFCALVDDLVLEFTRIGTQTHADDGVAWRSRVAFESLVWDEDGITLGSIRNQYYKLLFPKGTITANAYGLTRQGIQATAGTDSFSTTTTFTGIGQWDYSGNYLYGDDPGEIQSFGMSISVLQLKPKGLLAQMEWEIVADTIGTDYTLSAVNTKGFALDDLILKTR